jgi:hypothetical protein
LPDIIKDFQGEAHEVLNVDQVRLTLADNIPEV